MTCLRNFFFKTLLVNTSGFILKFITSNVFQRRIWDGALDEPSKLRDGRGTGHSRDGNCDLKRIGIVNLPVAKYYSDERIDWDNQSIKLSFQAMSNISFSRLRQ